MDFQASGPLLQQKLEVCIRLFYLVFNISRPTESTDKGTSLAFGVLSGAKGIAVVIGPLIADALHGKDNHTLQKYGSFGFTGVIIYVG